MMQPIMKGSTQLRLDERLADLERRLSAVERNLAPTPRSHQVDSAPGGDPHLDDNPYFVVRALQERLPAPGAVLYAGSVDLVAGHVEWQYAMPTGAILEDDWTQRAVSISALAHPVRLRILHLVTEGVTTVADLSEVDDLGTTGQVYHHVRQLTSAGWLEASGRGNYRVPPTRVIALLTILLAAR